MKEFLKKMQLIRDLNVELDISKNDFVTQLFNHVEIGGIGFMQDSFDVFSNSKKEYKGTVHHYGFEIKRKKTLFDQSRSLAVAKGTFIEKNGKLQINAEVSGMKFLLPILIFLGIIYGIFLVSFAFAYKVIPDGFIILPLIIFHGVIMLLMMYFFTRKSTKRLAYDLEREFYYLTKNASR